MIEGISSFWFLFPILLLIYQFGGGLLIRLIKKTAKPVQDYSYTPLVSILLPVFNESAHVLDTIQSIVACDWPTDKLEIVAYDDHSVDDSWAWMQQAAERWPQVRIFRNETNSGKHVTLSRALAQSKGEILICIDSDCLFDKKAIRELVSSFSDPEVGAVGGSIGITNVNSNMLTVCQTLVYFYSFQVGKMIQNLTGHLFCISGCLFAVRRELFEQVEHEVKNRNWFGLNVRDGEDRYMTHAILMRGWKTILNPDATCWTAAPDTVKQLFAQQIRWRRSGLRDLFWTWARLHKHFQVIGVWPTLAALVPETFTAMWTFLIFSAFLTGGFPEGVVTVAKAMLLFSSVFLGTALVYNATCKKAASGNILIKNILLACPAGAWFFMDSIIITLLALFTFDVGIWGTREKVTTAESIAKTTVETSPVKSSSQL